MIKLQVLKSSEGNFSFRCNRSSEYWLGFLYLGPCLIGCVTDFKKVRRFKREMRERLRLLQVWPVYGYYWSRDCDMCESEGIERFPTYWHLSKAREEMGRDAEGPYCLYQVSKKDAMEIESSFRDRIAESWDNGNTTPYSV